MTYKSQFYTYYFYCSFLNFIYFLLFIHSSSASSSSQLYIDIYKKIILNSPLSSSSVSINKNKNFNIESDYEENNDFEQFYLSNLNDYYSYNNTNPLFEISSDYGISSKEDFPLKDEVEYLLIKEYNLLHILKERRMIEVIRLSIILKNYLLYEEYIVESKSSFKEEYGRFYKSLLSNMSKRRFINAIKQKIKYFFNNSTYKLIYSTLRLKQNQLEIIHLITKNLCSEIENLINEDKVLLLKFYFSCFSNEKQNEAIINSNEFLIFVIFFIDENSVVISEGSEYKDEVMLFPLVDLLKTSALTIENDSQKMFLQMKDEDYNKDMIDLIIKKVHHHSEDSQLDYNFQFFYNRNIMKGSKLGKSTYKTLFSNMSLLENKLIISDTNWNFFINEKELFQKINSELNVQTTNNQLDLLVFPNFLNRTNFDDYVYFLYRKSYDSIEVWKFWYMLKFYMKELTCLSFCSTCICEYDNGFNNDYDNSRIFELYNGLSSDGYEKEYENHKSRLLILKIMNFVKKEVNDNPSFSTNSLTKHSLIEYFSILNFQVEVFLKKREYYIRIIDYIISLMVRRLYMFDIYYIKKMIIK